jgi:DNA-binding transcriptional regulator GbsR (MarR family)
VAVLKPRERLVYFRVSEDEFRQFVSVCEQAGARSVSDLARNAVQRLIAEGQRQRDGNELDEKMQKLERLIAAVTEQLRLLSNPPREAAVASLPSGAERFFWETTAADQNGQGEE